MQELILIAKGIIANYGYGGIFFLTAAEQFISPLPAADAALASANYFGLNFVAVFIIINVAVFAGASAGYGLGRYLGYPFVLWLFGKTRLEKAEHTIKKWEMMGIIIVGFTPLFRIVTWAAGIFKFPYHKYLLAVLAGRIPYTIITALAVTFFFKTKFYATTDMSAIILGALQGLTEFLPISSSGHLVILEEFLYLPVNQEEMAVFDILIHGGSLLAILLYFWRDWIFIAKECWQILTRKNSMKNTLSLKLVIGTIPAIFAALMFTDEIMGPLRNVIAIGIFFVLNAPLYFYASWKSRHGENEHATLRDAFLIGCAQAFALVPSISRSGMTIATAMLLGLKREYAARFSFLLGGIAILAANVYTLFSLRHGAPLPDFRFLAIGFVTTFIFSLLSIAFLIKYLARHSLNAFGIYLLVIGVLVLSFLR